MAIAKTLKFIKTANGTVLLQKTQDNSVVASFEPSMSLYRENGDDNRFRIASSTDDAGFLIDYRYVDGALCFPVIVGNNLNDFLTTLSSNFFFLAKPSVSGIQLHTGYNTPLITPPSTFNYADFYVQLDISDDSPIQLWQWNGTEWTTNGNVYSKVEIDLLLSNANDALNTGLLAINDELANKQDIILLDDSLVFYDIDGVQTLASNISNITSSFVWKTGNSTTFTLPFTPTNLIGIFINGLKLYKSSQFNMILPNQIEILQTLSNDDVIDFNYEHYNEIPV